MKIPRRPSGAALRQKARIAMQDGAVGLVADSRQGRMMAGPMLPKQGQELIAVHGADDGVEIFRSHRTMYANTRAPRLKAQNPLPGANVLQLR